MSVLECGYRSNSPSPEHINMFPDVDGRITVKIKSDNGEAEISLSKEIAADLFDRAARLAQA